MSQAEALRLEIDGAVARVTLTRPDIHNAFDDQLIAQLTETFQTLGANEAVRVIVLAGEGKSFCAGADLNWMRRMIDYSREQNLEDSRKLERMFHAIDTCPKPVIGRVHGAALGGGVGIVACCDIAIAAERAKLGLTEVKLGILPAVISPYVVRKIGAGQARALMLTGERIDAKRARRIGLVHEVVDPKDIDDADAEKIELLMSSGPQAIARCKQLVRDIEDKLPDEAADITIAAIAEVRTSPEGQEGMRAFLEKRSPSWRND
ncbi:MAG: enoyl-CoA hydratase/isomerase family protein [Planctomycetota bacterium]